MSVMEGPLSKWTNIMSGWQFRWFVLDNSAGILSYYISKEKMMKGSRRGCVRLRGAIIGIDDEEDSTFTITVDQKTFHFQARDSDERERWIDALESAIERQHSPAGPLGRLVSPEEFERKLMETDAYLQLLIDQNNALHKRIEECPDLATRERYSVINVTTDAMIEAIKHAIVNLQISKESLKEPVLNGSAHVLPPITTEANFNHFKDLYDLQDEEDLGSMEKHGSIIGHLLSQVRIGMDLTKVVLPTFILERRSLLEMYADFFAHPDYFCKIADMPTPRDRMVQVVRWYMSAFHAGRPSEIAKKPYNPILGETFQCFWTLPDAPETTETVPGGPIPWGTQENLCFIAEQVSHHPPISAFYAEHYNKKIALDGYIWTKSKFLGLSIGVHMIGQSIISVLNHDEEYIFTFPNGYGRSILTVPWVELGGKVQITCAKTGYNANIEFHTKPFYGGKKHRITGEIFEPNVKKPFVTIDGEWNGSMYAKYSTGMNEIFVDTKKIPIHKKRVKPLDQQGEMESRRLWKDVTKSLITKDVEAATEFKRQLEQRQRDEAKERKESGVKWETKNFHEEGEHWVYDNPILKRLH
ncbi:hypothetical protein BaRGS_00004726 [Batillaria attramentaria]|uniref:Oxysterol-binding protein n=1 Tax=Batillaria attramentaria TaxID=370345 RepID=A0ABD0LY80_9CAEN